VLRYIPLILLCGCVTIKRPLQPNDTEFNQNKRDWIEVYKYELEIAIDNKDEESKYFFLQEIIKLEYEKKLNIKLPENPVLRIHE